MSKFKGTGVAIVTPFLDNGLVDFDALRRVVNHIIDGGVNYVVVLGTTGESVTLSKTEKKDVVKTVIEEVNNRVPVVMGLGGNNTEAIIAEIGDTDFTGIDAMLSVSPYYNRPTQEGIYQHYAAIAKASPLPIILYNVPSRTGSNIEAATTLRLAQIDKIIAVKEASGDLNQCMEIINNKPADFLVVSGDDGLTLPILSCGGDGVISVLANALPKEFSSMVNAALNNNFTEAREWHYKTYDILDPLYVDGNPAGIKAALHILGICENNLRLPVLPVTDETYKRLQSLIKVTEVA